MTRISNIKNGSHFWDVSNEQKAATMEQENKTSSDWTSEDSVSDDGSELFGMFCSSILAVLRFVFFDFFFCFFFVLFYFFMLS